MSDFSNAKVGDVVYCLINGRGNISHVNNDDTITVRFDRNMTDYLSNGRLIEAYTYREESCFVSVTSAEPILYWTKPEIIEKKRKVKKSGWVNIFKEHDNKTETLWVGNLYPSREEAEAGHAKTDWRKTCRLDTVKIEFEVEE